MIVGSHNSWSYLPTKKWWMAPFKFMAKCQDVDIKTQYDKYNVRCFDLRIRFENGNLVLAHGLFQYKITTSELLEDLNYLNFMRNCYVRILHEVRNKKQYTEESKEQFKLFCSGLVTMYPDIKFWCGRNLYNWQFDYDFGKEPSCEEKYSSVCAPKILDDWWPKIYAKLHNKEIRKQGTDKEILLIDFVNYGY